MEQVSEEARNIREAERKLRPLPGWQDPCSSLIILLDPDYLSVFTDERDPRHIPLNCRMEAATEPIGCTVSGRLPGSLDQ